MDFRLLIDMEVLDELAKLKPSIRKELLAQFRLIQDYPSAYAEYVERDASGRRIDVCITAGFAIHYWEDSADRHVKVLALVPADR